MRDSKTKSSNIITTSYIILKQLHNELLTLLYERSVPTKGQGLGPGIPSFLKNP